MHNLLITKQKHILVLTFIVFKFYYQTFPQFIKNLILKKINLVNVNDNIFMN